MFSHNTLYDKSLPHKTLCLTFDDGPGETCNENSGPKTICIADFLKEQGIPATFFVSGKASARYPYILSHLINSGHTIGNHTYHHYHLVDFLSDHGDILQEIRDTDEIIQPYLKNNTIFFRPPYGAWTPAVADLLNENLDHSAYNYIGPVGYDIDTMDWAYWRDGINESKCADELLNKIIDKGSGIILMHDATADDEQINNANLTYETLKILIPELKKRDFSFSRLQDLHLTESVTQTKSIQKRVKNLLAYGVTKYLLDHKIKKYFTTR